MGAVSKRLEVGERLTLNSGACLAIILAVEDEGSQPHSACGIGKLLPKRNSMDLDQTSPRLFVGSCPRTNEDVDRLNHEVGITAVLNVQVEEDFVYWKIDWNLLVTHYRKLNIAVRRVPVPDFCPAALRRSLPECVEALDELLHEGHTVYVHCSAGINRSPSTVIAYLHWIERWDLDEAVAHVTKCRSCKPYVEAIRLATEDRITRRGDDAHD